MSYPRYAPGSHFESCPAATGELDLLTSERCSHFRDGAHRCAESRLPHRPHRCTCGAVWLSLPPAYADRVTAADPTVPASVFHRPRHADPNDS